MAGPLPSAATIDVGQRQVARLKWLTTIVPALAVFRYETVRHGVFEHRFPTAFGNLVVGLLTLTLAYAFSTLVFRVVVRLQHQALARGREVAALGAVIEERERLGRELHDGLAQLVTYMLVRLDTVADRLDAGHPEEASAELVRLRAIADDLYADIRESITALRTRVSERGFPATLRDYLGAFEERHGLAVDARGLGHADGAASLTGYQLLRIVQESLANVRKHADARRAWVVCARTSAGWLELTIGDDGKGFDVPRTPRPDAGGFGLLTMRERAEGLGGTCHISSRAGAGTRVVVTVPLTATPPLPRTSRHHPE